MFYLKQINLLNFKNYGNLQVNLHNGINVFTGANGIGKTNLIDAVHYLCMCKSFLSGNDSFNIKKGETVAMVQGNFVQDLNEFDVICNLRKEQKKVFKLNGKEYDKLADHVGRFPIVVVAPQDQALIQEGSDIRSRFVDSILSQTDRQYLKNLIKYNKALLQRNALLKTGQTLNELYEFFDFQLIETGQLIFEKRKQFFKAFEPMFLMHYQTITQVNETVTLHYNTQLNDLNMTDLLVQNFERDLKSYFTTAGIHKDDILFTLNDLPVKKYASQGQQKSITIALKLAQFTYISATNKPIMILDDIYDKLDDNRINYLMKLMQSNTFGQVLITDTHSSRVASVLEQYLTPTHTISIEQIKD